MLDIKHEVQASLTDAVLIERTMLCQDPEDCDILQRSHPTSNIPHGYLERKLIVNPQNYNCLHVLAPSHIFAAYPGLLDKDGQGSLSLRLLMRKLRGVTRERSNDSGRFYACSKVDLDQRLVPSESQAHG